MSGTFLTGKIKVQMKPLIPSYQSYEVLQSRAIYAIVCVIR